MASFGPPESLGKEPGLIFTFLQDNRTQCHLVESVRLSLPAGQAGL